MLFISRIKKMTTVLALTLGVSVFAFDWSAPFSGPKGEINTLVLTANYMPPLILAQLMMASNRQPYIQVPNSTEGKDNIIFFPAGKNDEGNAATGLQILEKDLPRFIRFVNPKQVMVIGYKRHVNEKYIKMIDKNIPLIILQGEDWERVAASAGSMFDIPTLAKDYSRIYNEWKRGYKPTPKPITIKEDFKAVTEVTPKGETVKVDESLKVEETPVMKEEVPADNPDTVKEPEVLTPAKAPDLVKG